MRSPLPAGIILGLAVVLASCAGSPSTATSIATLLPFGAANPTPRETRTTPTIAMLPTVGPSPTPVSYTIRANDTLSLIALRYGVTVEALQAANPGVNPNMLSIGQRIVIPAPAGGATEVPATTATPVPVPLIGPVCFRAPTSSLRCLVTARSSGSDILEGVTVLVTLVDSAGRPVLTGAAYSPLNLLRPGQPMVLDAFFDAPAPAYASAVATLAGAVSLAADDKRYENTTVANLRMTPGPDHLTWEVSGTLSLDPSATTPADRVALVALGLDRDGTVIGYTKWESTSGLKPGEQSSFNLTVYSLGPMIDSVAVQSEAQVRLAATP